MFDTTDPKSAALWLRQSCVKASVSKLQCCVVLYRVKSNWRAAYAGTFRQWAEEQRRLMMQDGYSVPFGNGGEAEDLARAGYFMWEASRLAGDNLDGKDRSAWW